MSTATVEKRRLQAGMKIHAEKKAVPLQPEEIKVGARVWIDKMKTHGVIESVFAGGNKATLSVNGLSVTVKTDELEKNRDGHDSEVKEPVVRISYPKVLGYTPSEINLVGKRVDEALSELELYLDRAALSRIPEVRIVHGFGSGALRTAIQECLAKNPLVREYHIGRDDKEEGGGGCTIVSF